MTTTPDQFDQVTHVLYARPRCGIPDPTNTGTCRMLLGHMGMHVGPVDGQHQSWHDSIARKEPT
jgi:hypothetical protein